MSVFVVSESQAREFLKALGRAKLAKQGLKRIAMAMNNIKELSVEEGKALEENLPPELKEFAVKLALANAAGEEIRIGEPGEAGGDGGETPKKKGKKAALKGEVDRFGTRKGTVYAKANAVLTAKPKPMKQIVQEAGLKDTCYNHLKRLIAAGLVVKTAEGFAMAKKEKDA